jgi:hypothetical protein
MCARALDNVGFPHATTTETLYRHPHTFGCVCYNLHYDIAKMLHSHNFPPILCTCVTWRCSRAVRSGAQRVAALGEGSLLQSTVPRCPRKGGGEAARSSGSGAAAAVEVRVTTHRISRRAMKTRRWFRSLGLLKQDLSSEGLVALAVQRKRIAAAKCIQRWLVLSISLHVMFSNEVK